MELEVETGLSQRPALEPNDATALTSEQQISLNEHKVCRLLLSLHWDWILVRHIKYLSVFGQVKVRTDNEMYLRKHPEVSELLSSFLR